MFALPSIAAALNMNNGLSPIDQIIVALFLLVTLVIGLRLKNTHADSAPGFLLGGRTLTLPAFIATTVSTWYGGILGVGEYAWSYGISNWIVFGVPYYFGAFLFACLLSKRARAADCVSIPERFESQFGKKSAKCAACLIFLTSVPGAYTLIMGTLCAMSFGVSQVFGLIATTLFVLLYLWRGGFSAVTKTDAVQFFLMFASFILLTLWLLLSYGLQPLSTLPPSHLSPTGGQPLSAILIWYVIALSTLTNPNLFQRCFAAKTPNVARNGMLLSILCWLFFDIMTTTCGLYARALLPDLQNPIEAFPALAAAVLPAGLIGIFFAGLFATVLSTLDSNLFTSAATLGRDIWPKSIAPNLSISAKTRLGLVLSALIAAAIAYASGSVVAIWKMFGSVSAASLLLPILATYFPSKIHLRPKASLLLMIAAATTTLLWFASKPLSGHYWLSLEPLFAGALVAIAIWLLDNLLAHRQKKKISSSHEL